MHYWSVRDVISEGITGCGKTRGKKFRKNQTGERKNKNGSLAASEKYSSISYFKGS